MKCIEAKSMFSPYLDGAVTGTEMLALTQHFDACAHCQGEFVSLRQTQQLLAKVGRRKAPEDLSLKLRLAISREVAHGSRDSGIGNGCGDFRISHGIPGLAVAGR
jgi:hypothetical protein